MNNFTALIVFVIAISFSSNSMAEGEIGIYVGAWSDHFASDYQYNESHNKKAISYRNFEAGYFENSHNDDTFYAGYDQNLYKSRFANFGVKAGVMYGYRHCLGNKNADGSKKLCPLAVPYARLNTKHIRPEILLMGNAIVITFRIDVKW